jgi:ABC-type polysaccharide/polyol phosphate transport system ATPase subunit
MRTLTVKDIAISVSDISMKFNLARERSDTLKEHVIARLKNRIQIDEFWALKNISFTVRTGQSFAIVGRNGSGKSTLMKLIAQVFKPTKGTITTNGAIAPMIELGAGFDDQLTAGENIYLNGIILGSSRARLKERYQKVLEFAELTDFENVPLKNFSSGMKARLGFAVATLARPEILIIDEVLGVGDYQFQKKCEERIASLLRDGTTLLLVSHSHEQVMKLCENAVWIDKGEMKAIGTAKDVCEQYQPLRGE